jgi:hypothetical protein
LPSRLFRSREAPQFRENFNRLPFQLSYSLGNHPLFEIPCLVELSQFLSRDAVTVYTDDPEVQQGWDRTNRLGMGAAECLTNIQTLKSWILLKDIQNDPAYNNFIDQLIRELETMINHPLRSDITWIDSYLFIASPRMDHSLSDGPRVQLSAADSRRKDNEHRRSE